MGNLVRDPELRVTSGGLSICKFTVASSRTTRDKDGNSKDETTFVDVECFSKQADTVAKFFSKGKPILVEGRLRLNEWESSTGEKRSKLLVVLESFSFVGTRRDSEENNYASVTPPSRESQKPAAFEEDTAVAVGAGSDEDVPF